MWHKSRSIRPFIGAKDFNRSRAFYRDLGFTETILGPGFSVFASGNTAFYLQDHYVKDWIDNTMVFLELENVQAFWEQAIALSLTEKYPEVRLVPIKQHDWGRECFIHDPSGILWHFGEFANRTE